jgi:hypothetical protein
MNARLLSVSLLAAGLFAAAVPLHAQQDRATPSAATMAVIDPAAQLEQMARMFRANDVAGLARAMVPPSQWEEMRLAYQRKQLEPISDEQRAEFDEKIGRLVGPDSVDELMAEIEPKLEQARPSAPGALLMAFGAMQMALNSPDTELTEEQRAALKSVLPGVQRWASQTDFLDSTSMRQALTLLTNAGRNIGISNLDQLKALPLDAVLDRAGTLLAAAKQAVRLYGIDLNAVADSLRVELLDIDGDTARVRTTVTLFDAPVWAEHELVLVEGRWYGSEQVIHWDSVEG